MKPFEVYSLQNITPVKALGAYLWDDQGGKYLDFYGGHAVISVGHSHPHFIQRLSAQLHSIGFYSNSVQIPLQVQLAEKLGQLSGYSEYQLFMCNSGAEANENALKLASFHIGRKKIIAFSNGFHGRTSAAVAATDNPKIVAPVNESANFQILPWDDEVALADSMDEQVAAVIIEGIQGVGGIHVPSKSFLNTIETLCHQVGALLIVDEIQSGYGRSGKFFAHQHFDLQPDLITVAKGMGNGFPVGAVLIAPHIKAQSGMLGTTFGGNHLACAASLAVLEIMEQESLIANARSMSEYLIQELQQLPGIVEIRGMGLMLGIQLFHSGAMVRQALSQKHQILVGSAADPNVIRLLPALSITTTEIDLLISALSVELNQLFINEAVH